MFQNQGFPPAAARQAAQTFVAGPPPSGENGQTQQYAQNSWSYDSNGTASVAHTMQNMQSILYAVQNGLQQMNNNAYTNSFASLGLSNPVQGSQEGRSNMHGSGVTNQS
jgi:hypothetical protein